MISQNFRILRNAAHLTGLLFLKFYSQTCLYALQQQFINYRLKNIYGHPLDFLAQNSYYLIRGQILFTDCPLYLRNERGVILYSFSNFETIQALPDIVTILELSQAIGLSHARTYQLLDERNIPYIRIQKGSLYSKSFCWKGCPNSRFTPMHPNLMPWQIFPKYFLYSTKKQAPVWVSVFLKMIAGSRTGR